MRHLATRLGSVGDYLQDFLDEELSLIGTQVAGLPLFPSGVLSRADTPPAHSRAESEVAFGRRGFRKDP